MVTSIGTLPSNTKSLANQLFLTPDGKVYAGKDTYYLVSSESDVLKIGNDISLLNNNANYIVSGTGSNQVRTNSELDIRYNVPTHVKNITTQNLSDWGAKLSDVSAGTNITIDKTDPQNPIISATIPDPGITSITLTGDVTGTGTESIATTIANNAVTTAKINVAAVTNTKLADNAVTLEKIQEISRGRLLGLGGGGTNTWEVVVPEITTPNGFSGYWNPNTFYSTGASIAVGRTLYRALSSNNAVNPETSPGTWQAMSGSFYGNYDPNTYYPANARVAVGSGPIYRTSAGIGGISPLDTPDNTPSEVTQIGLGQNLFIGSDNILKVSIRDVDINGLLRAGTNVTITGRGIYNDPYVINSTGGGGGGGSTTIIGGTDIVVNGNGTSGNPYIVNNTYSYNLPVASASTLGGVRVGAGLSISGGVLSATGTSASVFTRSADGLVPAPGGSGTTRYLREDGTWVAPSGGGSSFRLRSGSNAYLSNDVSLVAGTNVTLSQSGQNITINATGGGGSSVSLLTAGSSSIGAIRYAGVTRTNGQLYGGVSNPNNTTRLNYNGVLHAYDFVGYGISDIKLKTNLKQIESALDKVNKISGYSFDWKEDNDSRQGSDYGVIAQEIKNILPNAVIDREGILAISNGNQLVALLIEAVKELNKKVEELSNGLSR